MQDILKTFSSYLTNRCSCSGENLLIAVSGGADSVALAHLFAELKHAGQINGELCITHINHNLRGEDSDGDQTFVKELAATLDMPFQTRSVDVNGYAAEHKLSIETAARILRHRALVEMANELNCDAIATAHHANDNAETIVHRLIRGTGFLGLCGIWPVRNMYGTIWLRPMLGITRCEIEEYLNSRAIQYRHDHTNDDVTFTRNRIRRQLIPYLQQQTSASLLDSLSKLALAGHGLRERIQSQAERLKDAAVESSDNKVAYNKNTLIGRHPLVLVELIRATLEHLHTGLRDMTESHYQRVQDLIAEEKATIELPGRIVVKVSTDRITFERLTDVESEVREPVVLQPGQEIQFDCFKISCKEKTISAGQLEQFKYRKKNKTKYSCFV